MLPALDLQCPALGVASSCPCAVRFLSFPLLCFPSVFPQFPPVLPLQVVIHMLCLIVQNVSCCASTKGIKGIIHCALLSMLCLYGVLLCVPVCVCPVCDGHGICAWMGGVRSPTTNVCSIKSRMPLCRSPNVPITCWPMLFARPWWAFCPAVLCWCAVFALDCL